MKLGPSNDRSFDGATVVAGAGGAVGFIVVGVTGAKVVVVVVFGFTGVGGGGTVVELVVVVLGAGVGGTGAGAGVGFSVVVEFGLIVVVGIVPFCVVVVVGGDTVVGFSVVTLPLSVLFFISGSAFGVEASWARKKL